MDFRSFGTLLGMLGFLGVMAFGFYVLSDSDDTVRSERLCKPIRDVQNKSYEYFEVFHESAREKTRVFPRITEFLHSHCVGLLAERFFGEEAANNYRQKDWFTEDLRSIHQLSNEDVKAIVMVGDKSNVDWSNEAEREVLLNEFLEYKGVIN